MQDAWNFADAYEPYVGRWSRRLAPTFVRWAGLARGARVLDVGCGTGALAQAVLVCGAEHVTGVDLSPAYVADAQRRLGAARATIEVGSAQALRFATGAFDAAVSGLVLNFVPDPLQMLREMRRVTRPGGPVALYVWDYADKMEMMRRFWDAAIALDPSARALDEAVRFPICEPGALSRLARDAGLRDVETRAIDQPTRFVDFDDYWRPFLGGQAPAPGYCMALDPKARVTLREEVRRRLPMGSDGSIPLVARAWALKARA